MGFEFRITAVGSSAVANVSDSRTDEICTSDLTRETFLALVKKLRKRYPRETGRVRGNVVKMKFRYLEDQGEATCVVKDMVEGAAIMYDANEISTGQRA